MRVHAALLSLSLTVLVSAKALAVNTVSWGSGQPTTAAGKITGSGTYTRDDGWSAGPPVMTAYPTGGGLTYTAAG